MIVRRHRFALGYPMLAAMAVLVAPLRLSAATEAERAQARAATLSPGAQQQVVAAAIRAVKPALVKLDVIEAEYDEGRELKSETGGSGVIITPEGHVITNHHVAGNAKRILCTLADKQEIEADLVGTDPLSDIAIIKLKPKAATTFPIARFGDSSQLRQGDRVLAMGSPLAFSQSVTMGIIANTQLVMPRGGWYYRIRLEGEDVGSIVTWIAHDAQVFGGNSGGPLVNLKGEIVGINELRMGLGAAIPSSLAQEITTQLIAKGEVARAWIGLEVQPQSPWRSPPRGVLVSGAIPESPADKAGFQPGDILVRLGDRDVNCQFPEELVALNQFISALPIGAEVSAEVLRGEQRVSLRVRTERREKVEPKEHELRRWGLCARDLSTMTVKEMQLDSRDGALVTSLRGGGPSGDARPPLSEGDVIVAVGDVAVKTVAELAALTNRLTDGAKEPVPTLVTFLRRGGRYLTVVKVGIRELEDPGREVRKAWLPVATQVLTRDIAKQLGAPERTGVRITQIYPNSTAEKAGLAVGDIVVAVNGERIAAAEPQDVEVLPTMIRQLRIGDAANLTVLRDGKEQAVAVELVASPALPREMKRYRDEHFEFTARDVTFFDRIEQRWPPEQTGPLVMDVTEGSWAALGNLMGGDLILAVDGSPVAGVDALETMMKAIAERRVNTVTFEVKRGIHTLFVEMRPAWKDGG